MRVLLQVDIIDPNLDDAARLAAPPTARLVAETFSVASASTPRYRGKSIPLLKMDCEG